MAQYKMNYGFQKQQVAAELAKTPLIFHSDMGEPMAIISKVSEMALAGGFSLAGFMLSGAVFQAGQNIAKMFVQAKAEYDAGDLSAPHRFVDEMKKIPEYWRFFTLVTGIAAERIMKSTNLIRVENADITSDTKRTMNVLHDTIARKPANDVAVWNFDTKKIKTGSVSNDEVKRYLPKAA